MSDKSYGWFADENVDNNENISSSEPQKFLDYEGLKHLWSKINMHDYPNNEMLMAVINAIDETKADKSEITWANLPDKPFEGYTTSEIITVDNIEYIEELDGYYSSTILPFVSTNVYHVIINNIQYDLSTFEFQGITCIGSTSGPCVIMPADIFLSQPGIVFAFMSEEPIQSFSISYSDITSVKKIPLEVLPNVNWSNNINDQGYLLYEKIKSITIPFTIKDNDQGIINFSPVIDNINNIISISLKGENRNLFLIYSDYSCHDSSMESFDDKKFGVGDSDGIIRGTLYFAQGYGQLTSNVPNILTNFTYIELKYYSAETIDYKFFQRPIFIEEDLQNFIASSEYEQNMTITSALKYNTKVYGKYKNQLAEIDYYSFSCDEYPIWELYFHLIETNQYFINKFDYYDNGDIFNKIIEITPKLDLPEVATNDDVLDLLIETNIIEPIYSNNNEIFIDSEGNIFCL